MGCYCFLLGHTIFYPFNIMLNTIRIKVGLKMIRQVDKKKIVKRKKEKMEREEYIIITK